MLPLITAKREGRELDDGAIRDFVAAVSSGDAPDYQISAFLMAVFFRGMSRCETRSLTAAMAESGETYDWSDLGRPTADKHSTGGVGDKISLILAPLAVRLGLAVPMLSGRGLGFTGGTLDKLESIPGFRTRLARADLERQMDEIGCAFIGQSAEMAPADRRLYALRDVTATVESLPLIVSSILSKKIAAGPASLVIDLKVGQGAFMTDLAMARELGEALRDTALAFGRRCNVVFSAMDVPLGLSVGNRPELRESLELLAGRGPEDSRALTLALCAEMAMLAGLDSDRQSAFLRAESMLNSGAVLEVFARVAEAQGGSLDCAAKDWGLPPAPHQRTLSAPKGGWLQPPDARAVGRLTVKLGAGRHVAEDDVDPAAGLVFMHAWGRQVARGEEIVRVEGSDEARVEAAAVELDALLELADEAPPSSPRILAILDEDGYRSWSGPAS